MRGEQMAPELRRVWVALCQVRLRGLMGASLGLGSGTQQHRYWLTGKRGKNRTMVFTVMEENMPFLGLR